MKKKDLTDKKICQSEDYNDFWNDDSCTMRNNPIMKGTLHIDNKLNNKFKPGKCNSLLIKKPISSITTYFDKLKKQSSASKEKERKPPNFLIKNQEGYHPIYERTKMQVTCKNRKIEAFKDSKLNDEIKECTFKPKLISIPSNIRTLDKLSTKQTESLTPNKNSVSTEAYKSIVSIEQKSFKVRQEEWNKLYLLRKEQKRQHNLLTREIEINKSCEPKQRFRSKNAKSLSRMFSPITVDYSHTRFDFKGSSSGFGSYSEKFKARQLIRSNSDLTSHITRNISTSEMNNAYSPSISTRSIKAKELTTIMNFKEKLNRIMKTVKETTVVN